MTGCRSRRSANRQAARAASRLDLVRPALRGSSRRSRDQLATVRRGREGGLGNAFDDRRRLAVAVGGERRRSRPAVSVSRPADTGTVTLRVSPWPRSIAWISARPVRPLPSANGWIVSNWAWAIAACASNGRSVALGERDEVVDQRRARARGAAGRSRHRAVRTRSRRSRPAPRASGRRYPGAAWPTRALCIARIASASSRSARSSAARHRGDVADDLGGVAFVGAAELGQRDRLRAGRQVLDRGRRS